MDKACTVGKELSKEKWRSKVSNKLALAVLDWLPLHLHSATISQLMYLLLQWLTGQSGANIEQTCIYQCLQTYNHDSTKLYLPMFTDLHSNYVTSSKRADALICHTTMCRNHINFLYNPGHVTIWCVKVGLVANAREGLTQEHDWASVINSYISTYNT